ncbi:MAG TPA: carbohydrate ABC transporter permease [Solirubrobacteraceae bacterium]|nr:carbohydrate ABC transporter permease [Solirubrobacteraceae bacterium]
MATVASTTTRGRPRRPRGVAIRARLASIAWGTLAWFAGIIFFFPVLWMVITSFKPESAAYTTNPKFDFSPTLTEYKQVFSAGMGPFLINSAIATLLSVVLVLLLATPAAYALSLRPVGKWRDALFFFISTKMLPVVAAIVPIYLAVREVGLLDSIPTLIILYTAMNLPIAVWMMRSFFLEVPGEILEAARMDGADLPHELTEVVLPVVSPGMAATALICAIFSWNEFFFAVNLTSIRAATMPVFLVGFVSSEGLFWAKLAAAATIASVPVLIAGWIAQRQLVRGLSMGAIK